MASRMSESFLIKRQVNTSSFFLLSNQLFIQAALHPAHFHKVASQSISFPHFSFGSSSYSTSPNNHLANGIHTAILLIVHEGGSLKAPWHWASCIILKFSWILGWLGTVRDDAGLIDFSFLCGVGCSFIFCWVSEYI